MGRLPATVKLPALLLGDSRLTASTKVIWAFLQPELRDDPDYYAIRGLSARTGFSRNTVRRCLKCLASIGWVRRGKAGPDGRWPWQARPVPPPLAGGGPKAEVPLDLLLAHGPRAQCVVMYACLQLAAGGHFIGKVRYADLPPLAGVCYNTVKAALRDLEPHGWVMLSQQTRYCPVVFALRNPVYERLLAEVEAAKCRIDDAPNRGEQLMQECCNVGIASTDYDTHVTLPWLCSPRSGYALEFDRYYARYHVGVEFNGAQHYGPTAKYPDREAARQRRERDLWKLGLSVEEKADVIVIRDTELSLEIIRERAEGLLPLSDLSQHGPLVEYLERECREYREWASEYSYWPDRDG